MKFEFIVIEAPSANSPPTEVDSAFAVMETAARTLPTKSDPRPSVADVPTFQNTLHGFPPPVITTVDPVAVVSVEPIWKYHASSGEPVPTRVKTPDSWAEAGYSYTPGPSTSPPRFPLRTTVA